MPFPPEFNDNLIYSNQLDLDKLEVFMERSGNNPMFLEVKGLPELLTFGKHYGTISIKDPENSPYRFKDNSIIQFEVKDINGTVIFSDLAMSGDFKTDYSGASLFYIWVKEDSLRTYKDIKNGMGTLTFVGELEGVPDNWKNRVNYRCVFPIEIRKDLPNTSPILFQSQSLISSSLLVSESIEVDEASYRRSYIHVSASNLQTFGGKVEFIELGYREQRSKNTEFQILNTYPLTGSVFEISKSITVAVSESKPSPSDNYPKGLNPISDFQKFPQPKDIRRHGTVEYRLRFLNKDMEYAKDLKGRDSLVQMSSSLQITGSPLILETTDNLVTGSGAIIFGSSVNDGIRLELTASSDGNKKALDFVEFAGGVRQKSQLLLDPKGTAGGNATTDPDKNKTKGQTSSSVIFGGKDNEIKDSQNSTITAASGSAISSSDTSAIISSKDSNILIQKAFTTNKYGNVIISTENSTISHSVDMAESGLNTYNNMIAAGSVIGTENSNNTVLLGGQLNTISGSRYSALIGGSQNKLGPEDGGGFLLHGAMIGGSSNILKHDRSVIIGGSSITSDATDTVYVEKLDVGSTAVFDQQIHVKGTALGTPTNGHITASGNISASGTIYANAMEVTHMTSSFVTSSTIVTEGSNVFGDTISDTHKFNGHITASGDISASGTLSVGSFTLATLNTGNITSSGNISSSGTITAKIYNVDSIAGALTNTSDKLGVGIANNLTTEIGKNSGTPLIVKGHITASGNISASGDVKANIFNSNGVNVLGFTSDKVNVGNAGKPLELIGNITASGNISASDVFVGDDITFQGSSAAIFFENGTGATTANISETENSIRISMGSGNPAGKGHLVVSSSGGTATANVRVGIGTETPDSMLNVGGNINTTSHITASGNISSSGQLIAASADFNDGNITNVGAINVDTIQDDATGGDTTISLTGTTLALDVGSVDGLDFTTTRARLRMPLNVVGGGSNGHITASGNISSSGNLSVTGDLDLDGKSHFTGNITASGNISASGNVYGNRLYVEDLPLVKSGTNVSFGSNGIESTGPIKGNHITASGNISASGDLIIQESASIGPGFFNSTYGTDGTLQVKSTTSDSGVPSAIYLEEVTGGEGWRMGIDSAGDFNFYNSTSTTEVVTFRDNNNIGINNSAPPKRLTVGGDISASGQLHLGNPTHHIGGYTNQLGHPTGSSDNNIKSALGRGYGDIINMRGVTTVAGLVYGLQTNGNIQAADKDQGAHASGLLGVAMGTNSTTNGLLLRGFAQVSQSGQLSLGQKVYMGDSGIVTGSVDAFASGDFIRSVGYCVNSGNTNGSASIYFNPDNTFIEKA